MGSREGRGGGSIGLRWKSRKRIKEDEARGEDEDGGVEYSSRSEGGKVVLVVL